MKTFENLTIDGYDGKYDFEVYDNTEIINLGDKFIFFFAGIVDVQACIGESMKEEINPNDRVYDITKLDWTTGFWEKCYKIKSTNFDLTKIS
tara:strand:+ start:223634 stop:223909 length:276 start_codon:yes stop_codon:yes gene_type:complete